jgi:coproporphyrinogen III oxidase-like Fe-S oxidoreductase
MANDLQRHLAYGSDHLKHYIRHDTINHNHVTTWLARGEAMMAADIDRDTPMREALILALGENVAEGKARLKELRQAQLRKYLKTLQASGVYQHDEKLVPAFQKVIDEP